MVGEYGTILGGRTGNCINENRGYPYPHLGTLFRLSFCKMDFSVAPELWYNVLSERPPNVKSLLLHESAIQKPTLLEAGEKFWLQKFRYTDILTQTFSPPGLEDEVSSCSLGTCWFQRP